MEATKGDRIWLEAKKVGQPRRSGVVVDVTQGIAGVRYNVRWDDGTESFIAPGPGVLAIERTGGGGKTRKPAKSRRG